MDETYRQNYQKVKELGISLRQDPNEFFQLTQHVLKLQANTFVEIGTCGGGSLWMLSQYLPLEATIVSIDLPGAAWGKQASKPKKELVAELLTTQGRKVHLVEMDSHEKSTADYLRQLLEGKAIDFLFIDGDHSWEGVLSDWRMYHHMVRSGGMIAFHDIVQSKKTRAVKVWALWDVLKTIFKNVELVSHNVKGYGIGVLWK
jgi:predicted O-methyltransferase YrrM